jgi:radical SAM superfamily enzyme YgiQ (UPF0313 family)
MSKILLINPNKWGRGITSIWIASHSALLKEHGHDVGLFDATFYSQWTVDEVSYNTNNEQYQSTDYHSYVTFKDTPVLDDLQKKIDDFNPDIIFWSAISSHIHGEGEYVNIQYGYELINEIKTSAWLVTGGLQATASPQEIMKNFPKIKCIVQGYSEASLLEIASLVGNSSHLFDLPGVVVRDGSDVIVGSQKQLAPDLSYLPPYDYSIFDDQVFWRPYNGEVVRAIDYEASRGCIYSCEYCVETIIQKYYGFDEITKGGAIKGAANYVRAKSPETIFSELKSVVEKYKIQLIRCQDTNFLTMGKKTLNGLASLIESSDLDIKLYIETRPDGINPKSVELLKRLKVDGVGMGVELSSDDFREDKLKRFASTSKIINAFRLLKEAGIKRTSYNIIGLPEQDEESVIETVLFNRELDPDNITVAFYSPYQGTAQQIKGNEIGYFDEYEFHVDGQLRTMSKDSLVDADTLCFYKANFNKLVSGNLDDLPMLKKKFFKLQEEQYRGVGKNVPQIEVYNEA